MSPSGAVVRVAVLLMLCVAGAGCIESAPAELPASRFTEVTALPPPETAGGPSLADVLADRRSRREFGPGSLEAATVAQLLWAAQGVSDDEGRRTAPSAGGRYPLEVYTIDAVRVGHYVPELHALEWRPSPDLRAEIGRRAFGQRWVGEAPLIMVITAVVSRTEQEYGAVAPELVDREAGHAAQNALLQAHALGLAATPVGGFDPADVGRLLALPPGHDVLYLIPVGTAAP